MKNYPHIFFLFLILIISYHEDLNCQQKENDLLIYWNNSVNNSKVSEIILSEPEGFNYIDFGFIEIGKSDKKNFWIKNGGEGKFEIDSAFILGREGTTFTLISDFIYPKAVGPGERIPFEITFTPLLPKNFLDTLIVKLSSPFSFTYKIALSGASIIENIVWSPDTIAKIGEGEFKLPIRVCNTNKDVYLSEIDYRLIVSFDADLFYPISVTKGRIESSIISNGMRILTISDEHISLFGNEQVLTEITGYVLLGNNTSTVVRIQDIIWNKHWIKPNSKNGELHTYGLCGNSINQIKWKEDTEVDINPNPASQDINLNLKTNENGLFSLQIFSSSGVLCQSDQLSVSNHSNEFIEKKHRINIINLTSGSYYIVVTSPHSRTVYPISVIK